MIPNTTERAYLRTWSYLFVPMKRGMASLLDRFFLERPFSSISTDIFLTARHVIEACQKAMAEKLVGIVIKDPDDSGRSRIVPLGATENAPKPYDVAIGCTGKASRCLFRMGNAQALASFCDIATCGYPDQLSVTLMIWVIYVSKLYVRC